MTQPRSAIVLLLVALTTLFTVAALTGWLLTRAAQQAVLGRLGYDKTGSPSMQQQTTAPADTWFVERAAAAGLKFKHISHTTVGRYLFPEVVGGGVCLLDYDADGWLDVYFVQGGDLGSNSANGPGNRLFRNRGGARFEDVTIAAGVGDTGYGMGCACGDVDRDGDVDLFVTNVGADVLYLNQGDGTFVDRTLASGLGANGWGTSAAFFDFDNDGDLDLYVAQYVRWSIENDRVCEKYGDERDYCSPLTYGDPAPDILYRNDGHGTFTDISAEAGLQQVFGNGLGIAVADFNADGWQDVYVANDGVPNQLWQNIDGKRFEDRAPVTGSAVNAQGQSEAGMGVIAFDLEDDGDIDLLMTHLVNETNTCYVRNGDFFDDRSAETGLAWPSLKRTGFGIGVADFDQDGAIDVFVANGRVERDRDRRSGDPYADRNQLFKGLGGGRFKEVVDADAASGSLSARGAAFGDLDGDGDIDIVIVNRDGDASYLENVRATANRWVMFNVLDQRGHEALGAMVAVDSDQRTQWRLVQRTYSYQASNDPRAHFGLGADERITNVRVRWLDGTVESYGPLEPATVHTLIYHSR